MNTIKLAVLIGVCAALVQAQALTLVEARAKIGDAANDAKVMAETTAALSAADQVTFLAQVNEAISKMPGSEADRTAKFYAANKAALTNAKKGNLSNMLAETYATVSLEALTVINERFATELFNRAAGSGMTDAQFEQIAKSNMAKIQARTAAGAEAAERNTFAILMFVHAANGSPANLAETLVNDMPNVDGRQMAKTEWIPAALGKDQPKDYAPLLGSAEAEVAPVVDIQVYGPNVMHLNLLTELTTVNSANAAKVGAFNSPNFLYDGVLDPIGDTGINRLPRWVGPNDGLHQNEDGTWERDHGSLDEPRGYQNQTI